MKPRTMKPDFQAIPQFTDVSSAYTVDIGWGYLLHHLAQENPDMDPDFQRGHVWTPEQQVAYVEYVLRGGTSGNTIYLNCPGWPISTEDYVLVDGKQRLTAVMGFLRDEIKAFNYKHSEFTGKIRLSGPRFRWVVNNLPTRAAVLQWYLEMNTGGTVHSAAEINKVRQMLAEETA